jgi:hypothetical protein
LKNAFYGSVFAAGREFGLKNDTERAISNDLALRILHLSGFASFTIMNFLPDKLWTKN